ncbi:MAG: serine hydrolase domain-containing protein [Pseudomonadales bacterium]
MNSREARLTDLIEQMIAKSGTGTLLSVSAPLHGLDWRGAIGGFARDGEQPLTVADGFRIASMSKTFTATLVMMEAEAGNLRLGDRLERFFDAALIARAHPDASSITLRHLLNHTAGLWDFALHQEWSREIRRDPARFREPQEILEWAIGHGEPVGPVGGAHVYSDTGYVLLGRALEILTGQTYAELCRSRIFEPLAMEHTWLEGHEQPRSSLSHCYAGDWDALVLNGCLDWAAGGHVSTLDDLDKFLKGLFRDQSLVTPESLDLMLTTVPTPNHHYGLGVRLRHEHVPGAPATHERFWGHAGHWGSFMYYVPGLRATICGTENVAGLDHRWVFEVILEILDDASTS